MTRGRGGCLEFRPFLSAWNKDPDPGWKFPGASSGVPASDSNFSGLAAAWGNKGQTGRPDSSHLTFSTWGVVRLLPNIRSSLTLGAHFGGVCSSLLEEFLL